MKKILLVNLLVLISQISFSQVQNDLICIANANPNDTITSNILENDNLSDSIVIDSLFFNFTQNNITYRYRMNHGTTSLINLESNDGSETIKIFVYYKGLVKVTDFTANNKIKEYSITYKLSNSDTGEVLISPNCITSIQELNDDVVNVHQENEHLIFKSNNSEEIKLLTIFNLNGQIVLKTEPKTGEYSINTSSIPNGICIYSIQTEKGLYRKKLILNALK